MTAPKIPCAGCHRSMPDVGFATCATCTFGPAWSKSSVGAGDVVDDWIARRKRVRESGLEVVT